MSKLQPDSVYHFGACHLPKLESRSAIQSHSAKHADSSYLALRVAHDCLSKSGLRNRREMTEVKWSALELLLQEGRRFDRAMPLSAQTQKTMIIIKSSNDAIMT
jgi:hypothetical protein